MLHCEEFSVLSFVSDNMFVRPTYKVAVLFFCNTNMHKHVRSSLSSQEETLWPDAFSKPVTPTQDWILKPSLKPQTAMEVVSTSPHCTKSPELKSVHTLTVVPWMRRMRMMMSVQTINRWLPPSSSVLPHLLPVETWHTSVVWQVTWWP